MVGVVQRTFSPSPACLSPSIALAIIGMVTMQALVLTTVLVDWEGLLVALALWTQDAPPQWGGVGWDSEAGGWMV